MKFWRLLRKTVKKRNPAVPPHGSFRQNRDAAPLSSGLNFKLFAVALGFLLAGCATPEQKWSRLEFSRPEMGLPFRIVLFADNPMKGTNAAETAFQRIEDLNQKLSDYEYDSELSQLSRSSGSNQFVTVSTDLWKVLRHADTISRVSGGAFDVTVGPVVNLWRKARREKKFPNRDLLRDAMARIGYTNVVFDPERRAVKLLKRDMRLDLGGIAKGYALDEALHVLKTNGIQRALVTGGGDMRAGAPPPGKRGWRVELAPSDWTNSPPPRFVLLRHQGMATSGDLFQHVELEGVRYSHIVNPATGLGLTDRSQVVVIAPSGMEADALSKGVSILGPKRGLALANQFPRTHARIAHINTAGKLEEAETPRFHDASEK
jgi:thiamine biosynthesis lipoprotein